MAGAARNLPEHARLRRAVLPFEVIYLHDGRGFSVGVAGLVVGTVTGAAVITAPLTGPLIDRFGVRATAVSRVAANAGFGCGGAIGGFVAAYGLHGFVALFLGNALTYLIYVAQAELGVGEREIGLLLLANAATVVVAQVPVARLAEGRRRVVLIALAGACFAAAFVLVVTVGAYPALVLAAVVIALGECLHSAALMPLVADLAPAALRGRYMAAIGLSFWAGLAPHAASGRRAPSPFRHHLSGMVSASV